MDHLGDLSAAYGMWAAAFALVKDIRQLARG
jgi:hypothetical protein